MGRQRGSPRESSPCRKARRQREKERETEGDRGRQREGQRERRRATISANFLFVVGGHCAPVSFGVQAAPPGNQSIGVMASLTTSIGLLLGGKGSFGPPKSCVEKDFSNHRAVARGPPIVGPRKNRNINETVQETRFGLLPAVPGRRATSHD